MPSVDSLSNTPLLWVLLGLAALLVGLSKGGLPAIGMLSVPILSTSISPVVAAALLLPIYVLSDMVSVWLYRREFSTDNLKILIPAGIAGVLIGWATAAYVSDRVVALMIGIMGISFCLYTWTKNSNRKATPTEVNVPKGIFWGTLSGFTSFVAHAGAPPFQIYVLPQKLPKMMFAGTTTMVFAAVNLAKIIPYSQLQPYGAASLKVALYLVPVAAIGTLLGKLLIERLSEKWFFLAVQIALFIISIKLVVSYI